jgi:hypothetical protein
MHLSPAMTTDDATPEPCDHPDNGHRVEVLGAGSVVPRDRMSGPSMAAALRRLAGDASVGGRLSTYREALAQPRAVERAAALLERVHREAPLPTGEAVAGQLSSSGRDESRASAHERAH